MKLITPLHRFFCLALLVSAQCTSAFAQNNSNFKIHFSTETADTGDTVCVAVRAFGFKDIVGMQFGVKWPASQLEAINADVTGTSLPVYQANDLVITPGLLKTSWLSLIGSGITLPDSSLLFQICFRVKATTKSLMPVYITPDDFYFEVTQWASITDPFVSMPLNQKPGGVYVGPVAPLDYPILSGAQIQKVHCETADGSIKLTVKGGALPYTFAWSGPNQFVSDQKDIIGVPKGQYSVTITDHNKISVIEDFTIKTLPSSLSLASNTKPAFCGAANGCIELFASNGAEPFRYEWSDGVTGISKRCNLLPGTYKVTLTDNVGCQKDHLYFIKNDTDINFQLSGNTGLLNCKQLGFLDVQVDTALHPNLHFLWSTGATTVSIYNIPIGIYTVTVTSTEGCSAVQQAVVYDKSDWDVSARPICNGTDRGDVALTHLSSTFYGVKYPITLSWNDGTQKMIAQYKGQGIDTLKKVPMGAYTVTITDREGCSKALDISLSCETLEAPTADTLPFFYLEDPYLSPLHDKDTCVELRARNFRALKAMDLSLTTIWPISTIQPGTVPGLELSSFTKAPYWMDAVWRAPGGIPVTLPDSTVLFGVCFEESYFFSNPPPNMGLAFDETFEQKVLDRSGRELPFACRHGSSSSSYWSPYNYTVCGVNVTPPDCAADGFSKIQLERCWKNEPLLGFYRYQNQQRALLNLKQVDKGFYTIKTSRGNLTTTLLVKVPYQSTPTPSCTWPGDADDNNAVNHHDLLYLGLAYQSEGPARANTKLDWEGQDAPTWTRQIPGRKVDYRNIDTNGDGHIDAADTLAIARNWGRVVNTAVDDPFNIPTGVAEGHNPPPLQLKVDTLTPGQTALLPLSFGSPTSPVDSFYGLAFSISYDPRFFNPDTRFYPTPSWMGQPQELLWMQRNFPEQGRLDIAITRTDGHFVSGGGPIGNLLVSIRNDVFGPKNGSNGSEFEADSLQKTSLFFGNPQCLNAQGDAGPVKIKPAELVIRKPTSVAANEPDAWTRTLVLSPNPAAGVVRIQSPGIKMERVEILDVNGRLCAEALVTGTGATCQVDFLPPGTYWVRVFATAGVALKKLIVAR